ncbi:MAG: hypothetical protein HKN04_15200 [Rhodothermaceae bacterium]|nr:hypothetical protein [Rhodothermaceae bacterium]
MELPDEHELIWLFEQEPELLDSGQPWAYNHLTFSVERNGERLVCMIAPGYGDVQVHLTRGDRSILDLVFGFVRKLEVQKEQGAEVLVVDFGLDQVNQLRVQTKPHFHVSWGTALQGGSE